jgi:serine/threonine protein phosphatase PrpC
MGRHGPTPCLRSAIRGAWHGRVRMPLVVAGKSDLGCLRENNEDSFGYDAQSGIFVVCDGMGGQACGEVASKLAVDTVLQYVRSHSANRDLSRSPQSVLLDAIGEANATIREAAAEDGEKGGMGTTIVAALVQSPAVGIAHVGDSRIYLFRDGRLQQLTQDHSLVMEQVRRGIMTLEQAQTSTLQNIILRALGSEAEVEIDTADLKAATGDVLLLCSDGLTRMINDNEILKTLSSLGPRFTLQNACDQLIEQARDAGGEDNITCLLVQFAP